MAARDDRAPGPTRVAALSDRYIEESSALDPIAATARGVPGHDDRLTDYSPEGHDARAELAARTRAELARLEPVDDHDRRGAALLAERLGAQLAIDDQLEHLRHLNNLSSPLQSIRRAFDLMPTDTAEQWETIAARMDGVPDALAGFRSSLAAGVERGITAAQRQADVAATQAAAWAGTPDAPGYYSTLVEGASDAADDRTVARLTAAAQHAEAAYADTARWLRDEYLPAATTIDGVGAERYAAFARLYLGAEPDLDEIYDWGWEELHRIEAEMAAVATEIVPGGDVEGAKVALETDAALTIEGEDHLRAWLQELIDTTIDDLDGTHFDIPAPLRRCEAMIAPPGGAAAPYYTGPSEDFSRPGRTWYPTLGKTRFPLWGEVSVCYHESVPGHHLQIGQVRYLADTLTRYQRMAFVSGHGEGWALYAERLMDEIGAYDGKPGLRLGMLRAQVMRAVRVVVDIGMHLGKRIDPAEAFHPGEPWTTELANEFVLARSHFPADFMASEVLRYLGMPAQAISYKVGEREWLAARDDVKTALGGDYDAKVFHQVALDLGPLGLADLRRELVAAATELG